MTIVASRKLDEVIAESCLHGEDAVLLTSIPGAAAFTASSLACRVPEIKKAMNAQGYQYRTNPMETAGA